MNAGQEELRAAVRDFVQKELPPGTSRHHDAEETFPLDKYLRFAEMGYLGIGIPEEYGGRGGGFVDLAIMLEELAQGMMSFALMVFRSAVHGAQTLLRLDDDKAEEQRKYFLPKIVEGSARFSLSLSEYGAGSDAAGIQLRADRDGDDFVLNGQKHWSSALDVATHIIVVARTDQEARHRGVSIFLVPSDHPGLTKTRLHALGDRASGTWDVEYRDVRVPATDMLGSLNAGWLVLMADLEKERLCQCAYSAGGSRAVLDRAIEYARSREQFGQPIGSFQVIQHKLADMATEAHIGRLMLYDLAQRIDRGERCDLEASMAKLYCTEMYYRVADNALQIHGGQGYMMDSDMQLHLRDARLLKIGGGTVEVMRNIIAKRLGLPA
ncbi:MAG TPA: acyl-CoA dehydrogenase family protein [Acidimicrobiales bacterium]|jgi:alkylation response protein AidB-like acyl-CoA dehydrogenase|nr:acyl-CoA dehydrogenase family protein [Acidimicrobiales bacterium]